jgi:hypothetical protein
MGACSSAQAVLSRRVVARAPTLSRQAHPRVCRDLLRLARHFSTRSTRVDIRSRPFCLRADTCSRAAGSCRGGFDLGAWRANAKHSPRCLSLTTRLDLIGWTWTISLLIFPRNKFLFEAFYVWVYVYVFVYVSLWFSEPYMYGSNLPRKFLWFAF